LQREALLLALLEMTGAQVPGAVAAGRHAVIETMIDVGIEMGAATARSTATEAGTGTLIAHLLLPAIEAGTEMEAKVDVTIGNGTGTRTETKGEALHPGLRQRRTPTPTELA